MREKSSMIFNTLNIIASFLAAVLMSAFSLGSGTAPHPSAFTSRGTDNAAAVEVSMAGAESRSAAVQALPANLTSLPPSNAGKIPSAVIERTADDTSPSTVTKKELAAAIVQLEAKLLAEIASSSALVAQGFVAENEVQNIYKMIADSLKIDRLSSVAISNPTFQGNLGLSPSNIAAHRNLLFRSAQTVAG
jgi:hypothetical protein